MLSGFRKCKYRKGEKVAHKFSVNIFMDRTSCGVGWSKYLNIVYHKYLSDTITSINFHMHDLNTNGSITNIIVNLELT
jgi:hypothetical protein